MSTLQAQLPALQIVVPLLAAPLCSLLRRPALAWGLAAAVSGASFAVAAALAVAVSDGSEIAYLLGGWAAPWGIEYRIDALNALVLVIVTGASTVTLVHARLSVAREVRRERIGLFYTAWLLCLTGMLGMAITGDAFNVFVFLENLVAGDLRPGRPRPRARGAARRVPLPRPRLDRRDLLPHRGRAAST